MTPNFLSKLPNFILCSWVFFSSFALQAASSSTGDLRQRAAAELRTPPQKSRAKKPAKSVKTTSAVAAIAPIVPVAEPTKPYLQSVLPADLRENGRPQWTLEIGLENQKPQGELAVSSLSALDLNAFESRSALNTTLSWWMGELAARALGPRWRGALAVQMGWSRHSYGLELPGRRNELPMRLQVLRPQLGGMLEYLAATRSDWNTEFWLGASVAGGRLMQSQTSQDSDLLNVSLNQNYWELGTEVRSVIAGTYIVNLQYRNRIFGGQEGSTHHGVLALGIAL